MSELRTETISDLTLAPILIARLFWFTCLSAAPERTIQFRGVFVEQICT